MIGWELPTEFGGAGIKDFCFDAILTEEFKSATGAVDIGVQNDIVAGYMDNLTTHEQKWLPGYVSGELINAIAMRDPGAGSDPAKIASARRDGADFILNGSKTFILTGCSPL